MTDEEQQLDTPPPYDDPLDDVYGKSIRDVLATGTFDNVTDSQSLHRGGAIFRWSRKGIGFGTIQFGVEDGKPYIDTETMGKEFVLDVIVKALTPIIDAEEEDARQWWAAREAEQAKVNDGN